MSNHSILCHYEESLEQEVIKYAQNLSHSIIAIREDSGIISSENSIEAIGAVAIFNKDGSKKVFKDEPMTLL